MVAIGANVPRISAGASGLGSQVSSWLGPPHWKIRMHDFARPNPGRRPRAPALARPRNSSGKRQARASPGPPPGAPRAGKAAGIPDRRRSPGDRP